MVSEGTDIPCITDECAAITLNRQSCFVHTLQFVVNDGLAKINPVLKLVSRKCLQMCKCDICASELLKDYPKQLLANATYTLWNSQLQMCHSILQLPTTVLDELDI